MNYSFCLWISFANIIGEGTALLGNNHIPLTRLKGGKAVDKSHIGNIFNITMILQNIISTVIFCVNEFRTKTAALILQMPA